MGGRWNHLPVGLGQPPTFQANREERGERRRQKPGFAAPSLGALSDAA